ncbi:hypothetical protein Acy02nite_17850 [Actinoplanes cyaneus]|uniref:Uncharacterized protein n=1 Tax=Actinoplanes cyaneus TaxID=52696 RepID=A0A919M607_9ACTN|nr:hypothetical protein [Actinoplanes cyaneus]MCW2136945.1 hypothetical protein [Actinoplanes cyaneus]GID63904.1 hypothetical protein Acy02nite_17850 [Actinoplanes cyaneus]
MATIVEIHVPLTPAADLEPGVYPFPWIERVEDFLIEIEEEGTAETYDEGEEFGGAYVFFLAGADEEALLSVASRVATFDGVPTGAFAMITDSQAPSMGMGRRIDLPTA